MSIRYGIEDIGRSVADSNICPFMHERDCVNETRIGNCVECVTDYMREHDAKVRAEVIEFISDKIIYPLLDECDRGLWEHIDYIELAEEWIKVLDDNPYPKVKNHTKARKRDLKQWIAEKFKEKKND